MKISEQIAAAILSMAILAEPRLAQAAEVVTPAGDIVQTLTASGQFATLLKAAGATNLVAVLKGKGPLTLFAPTDAAFKTLPPGQLDALLGASPPSDLRKLLIYHLINAGVSDSQINGSDGPVPSVAGAPLYLDGQSMPYHVDGVTIEQGVPVSNGVIYVIDQVLSPNYKPES